MLKMIKKKEPLIPILDAKALRGSDRKRAPVTLAAEKTAPAPPQGRGGKLWQSLLETAKKLEMKDPEKFADTALRSRERSIAIKAGQHKLLLITEKPKVVETCTAVKAKKVKTCKSRTLEGSLCRFRATCGDFCKKHSI